MITRLIKEAEFDFNEGKYTAIPSSVFSTLIGEPKEYIVDPEISNMVMFEDKEDYLSNGNRHNIDYEKSIYVSAKGQILCYLKQ